MDDKNRHTFKDGILSWRPTMRSYRCSHVWLSLNKLTKEENLIKQPSGNISTVLVIAVKYKEENRYIQITSIRVVLASAK